MSEYTFREVFPGDIPAWWELRLRALHDHPDAFGSDYEESRRNGPSYAERGYFDGGVNRLFAAFTHEGMPVAQAGTTIESGKRSHIAHVISVYTHPDHRGHGLAGSLVQIAIDHLHGFPEITSIRISVNATNTIANHTYEKLGFVAWGEEPDAIRTADGSCHNERHMVLSTSTHRSLQSTGKDPMSFTIPTPEQFADMTWEEIEPLYTSLVERELPDDAATKAWLDDWNALDTSLMEAGSVANVEVSCDSQDEEKEKRHLRFSSEIMPQRGKIANDLTIKLLDSGYAPDDLKQVLKRAQTDRDIFREENVPLQQDLSKLNNAYNKTAGGMTVEWDGETVPLSRLNPFMEHPDRDVREKAWRLHLQPYADQRDKLADIFDEQLTKRQQVAKNAGFENYRDYIFADKYRYDYTPEDSYSFHDAVSATFVPALLEMHEERRQKMGVDSLRPWDLTHDPDGAEPLKPYESIDDLTATAQNVFARVDPLLGEQFGVMRKEGLLDLDARAGKRPGGFCTSFPYRKRPFIFMNASGTGGDVRTLLHEAGHAFHGFATMEHLPYLQQRRYGSEMAEVASMSMELLASPYLHKRDGGFYESDEDYARAKREHLAGIVKLFTWVAPVDAFQQWVYSDPAAADRDARDAKWVEIWNRFDPETDWSDLNDYRVARWYKQLHIFLYPFYYIEYAIAQLGALQVWRNALADQEKAVADYRAALALGGSKPLPELFDRAGARLIFDEAGMAELVALIQQQIAATGDTN